MTPRKASAKTKERPKYPWLRLLEMERERPDLHPAGEKEIVNKPRGRPRNPFPRKRVVITLTEDEIQALDSVVQSLSPAIPGVFRGNLISLLVFYLRDSLDGIDINRIKSFSDLVKVLDVRKEALRSDRDDG